MSKSIISLQIKNVYDTTQLTLSLGSTSQILERRYIELEFRAEMMALSELKFLSMRNSWAISIHREMFRARSW